MAAVFQHSWKYIEDVTEEEITLPSQISLYITEQLLSNYTKPVPYRFKGQSCFIGVTHGLYWIFGWIDNQFTYINLIHEKKEIIIEKAPLLISKEPCPYSTNIPLIDPSKARVVIDGLDIIFQTGMRLCFDFELLPIVVQYFLAARHHVTVVMPSWVLNGSNEPHLRTNDDPYTLDFHKNILKGLEKAKLLQVESGFKKASVTTILNNIKQRTFKLNRSVGEAMTFLKILLHSQWKCTIITNDNLFEKAIDGNAKVVAMAINNCVNYILCKTSGNKVIFFPTSSIEKHLSIVASKNQKLEG